MRQIGASQKQTFSSAHTKRVVKSKRLSGDHSGFFNRSLLLFLFIVLTMKTGQLMRKRYRRCARLQRYRAIYRSGLR
ncbi:hypothetical protein FA039_28475 [Escherichia coli]|nr:hypothetical protein [Escherichia coli]